MTPTTCSGLWIITEQMMASAVLLQTDVLGVE